MTTIYPIFHRLRAHFLISTDGALHNSWALNHIGMGEIFETINEARNALLSFVAQWKILNGDIKTHFKTLDYGNFPNSCQTYMGSAIQYNTLYPSPDVNFGKTFPTEAIEYMHMCKLQGYANNWRMVNSFCIYCMILNYPHANLSCRTGNNTSANTVIYYQGMLPSPMHISPQSNLQRPLYVCQCERFQHE